MSTLTANELKTRGVSAVEDGLKQGEEVMISVRGQSRYVVMDIEKYNRLRELELTAAVAEARADYAAGRFTTETVAEHMQKLKINQ
ncbi:MAG: type II toxin-antitoxin system Phd/YefM family antitoxin [Gammaproteobacteria bacterium]